MKILCIGDIVGAPGRLAVKTVIKRIKDKEALDFVIANSENAAGGTGLTPRIAQELLDNGCDCLTNGDHIWKHPEILQIINHPQILRPANYPPDTPGKGHCVLTKAKFKVGVINLQGRVFMQAIDCPFRTARQVLAEVNKETNIIFVDIHAEATSEKIALGYFLDGKVTCLFGTHTHIQTADEKILPQGSAYITDLGMSGPYDSVIGQEKSKILTRFLTSMPARFEVASEDAQLHGAIVEVDENSGKAISIKRVQEKCA